MLGHPACIVAMEACGSSHYWAREMAQMGHEPRLIAPRYVKPFVKRHKNDAADAEAIVEAALRPTMRFVDPKTQEQQGGAVLLRIRALFIRQRTEAVNALRAHPYEFGYIAPVGIQNVKQLVLVVEADNSDLPEIVRFACKEAIEQITRLTERLAVLDKEIARLSGQGAVARRLRTMPPLAHTSMRCRAAGRRPDHGACCRNLCSRDGKLSMWARLCGMAWSGPVAAIDRRQADIGQNLENGPARQPPLAYHRRDGSGGLGRPTGGR